MKYSEALEIVQSLARGNQIDEIDIAFGEDALLEQRRWQEQALDTLEDLISNHAERLDDAFSATDLADDIEITEVMADRASDPSDPASAVRICLDLCRDNVLDDDGEEARRQIGAIIAVENFIKRHSDDLSRSVTVVKLA